MLTKNCVGGIQGNLIFGCITDQSLCVSEGNVTGCGPITLIVGNDFNFAMLKHTHTRVCGAKINSNCWSL